MSGVLAVEVAVGVERRPVFAHDPLAGCMERLPVRAGFDRSSDPIEAEAGGLRVSGVAASGGGRPAAILATLSLGAAAFQWGKHAGLQLRLQVAEVSQAE